MDADFISQVLVDISEAIIGPVFVDSRHDLLAVVWRVYTGLCPQLDAVVANPAGATHPSPSNSPQPLDMNKHHQAADWPLHLGPPTSAILLSESRLVRIYGHFICSDCKETDPTGVTPAFVCLSRPRAPPFWWAVIF